MAPAHREPIFAPDDKGPRDKLCEVSHDGIVDFCNHVALAEALPEGFALLPNESDARPAVVRHEGDIHLAVGHAVSRSTIVWLEGEAFLPGIEDHGTIVQP